MLEKYSRRAASCAALSFRRRGPEEGDVALALEEESAAVQAVLPQPDSLERAMPHNFYLLEAECHLLKEVIPSASVREAVGKLVSSGLSALRQAWLWVRRQNRGMGEGEGFPSPLVCAQWTSEKRLAGWGTSSKTIRAWHL